MSDRLAGWINEQLQEKGWSQNELAKRSGASRPLISQVLSGDMPPSADFCIKVAQAFGEVPEKLLRLAGILPLAPGLEDDSTLAEMQDIIRNLPPAQRKEALRYLRYLFQTGQKSE